MTSYYALLRVITRYYRLLDYMERKDYSVKFLRISGNVIVYARIILCPLITRYYPLLPVITLYGEKKTTR